MRLAQKGLDWSALLISSLTSGAQTTNQGVIDVPDANRTKPNPESNHQRYLLAKMEKQLSGYQNIVLTLEDVSKYRKTNLYSARTSTIFDHQANDQLKRQRISIDMTTKKSIFGFEDESSIKIGRAHV